MNEDCFPDNFSKGEAIFIAADDLQEKLILKLLAVTANNINIINYDRFKKTSFENPIENMNNDAQYTGLILEMSHSQCSIRPELLNE